MAVTTAELLNPTVHDPFSGPEESLLAAGLTFTVVALPARTRHGADACSSRPGQPRVSTPPDTNGLAALAA